jgi:PST family polysaccharide transporter
MTLIKTSILTAIATVIKVITSFVINKLVSIYVGPSGLALIGQFQNFTGIVTTFATGGLNNGVVKYVAEYKDKDKKEKILGSALLITLGSSFIVSIVVMFFSSYFSQKILQTDEYTHVFIMFSVAVIFFALNMFLMSILNGQKEIKKYITVNIVSSLLSLFFTSLLVVNLGLLGVLYALVLNQSVVFFVTLMFVIKSNWFRFENFTQGIDKPSSKKLGKFALMAATSSISLPIMLLIVRDYIGKNFGWDAAGYWQGIWYISSMYLMVVTSSLSVYYLPRLSEITDKKELKKEIISGYKIIMPIVISMAVGIYFLRELVITIAFTEKFLPMEELFLWQLIGDVIKIASWLLSYLLLAKAMTRVFIYTEIGFKLTFMTLAYFFLNSYGLVGITYAFALNYVLYFFTMMYIFRSKIK